MSKQKEKNENNSINITKKEIATRIRAFRKDQKLTQRRLGEILGINFQHVSKYERGEFIPTFENLIKFNTNFKLNLNWLLTGSGSMYVDQKEPYVVTGEEANQVIRDEDEMLGEIIEVLRGNEKLKVAVYELLQTYKNADRASDRFREIVQDLLIEKMGN